MQIRTGSVPFGPAEGPARTGQATVTLSAPFRTATALLTGFTVAYASDEDDELEDHELGRLEVRLDTSISGLVVTVTATYGLRDWSGEWDDRYEGEIFFAVIAE